MAYNKRDWVDHIVEEFTGNVIQLGTPLRADYLNNIEQGIKDIETSNNSLGVTRAPINSPALTGIPTAPTAIPNTNTNQLATTAFIQAAIGVAISALVNGSQASLDTLKEFATALGNDANFSTTIMNLIGTKATAAQGTKADNALPATAYTAADILAKLKTVDGIGSGIDSDLLDGLSSSDFAQLASSPDFTGVVKSASYGAIPTSFRGNWLHAGYWGIGSNETPNLVKISKTDIDGKYIDGDLQLVIGNSNRKVATYLATPSTAEKNDIVGMINEVFTNATNGQKAVATELIAKGIPALLADTYTLLASKIKAYTFDASKLLTGNTVMAIAGTMPNYAGKYLPANGNAGDIVSVAFGTDGGGDYGIPTFKLNTTGYVDAATTTRCGLYGFNPTVIKYGTYVGNFALGVVGEYTGDANAAAAEIFIGKTAYVKGAKITGAMASWSGIALAIGTGDSVISTTDDPAYPGVHAVIKAPITQAGYVDTSTIIQQRILNLNASNIKSGVRVGGTSSEPTRGILGTFTSDANAVASDILVGQTAYVKGAKVTGTIPILSTGQALAAVSIDGTGDVQRLYMKPPSGNYFNGANICYNDANFISANIKAGKSIFGLPGKTEVVDTTETLLPMAVADMLSGKVAFVNGIKRVGTMPNNGAINRTPSTSAQAIPAGYTTGGTVAAVVVPVANVLSGTVIAGAAGTMPSNGALNYTPGLTTQAIPMGYTSGGTVGIAPSNIKSIQRGEATIAGGQLLITIAAVDIDKAIVQISICTNGSSSAYSCWAGHLMSPTVLVLDCGITSTAVVSWQVTEFNNVKSLQKGATSVLANPQNVPIASVVPNKTMVFTSMFGSSATSHAGYAMCEAYLSSSTNLLLRNIINLITVYWYVLEFN